MSQWTKRSVEILFGSKCSVDVPLVDVLSMHPGAGTVPTWTWSGVCTRLGVCRVHRTVHNNSPRNVKGDHVRKISGPL
jgi:hypothetical protein